MCGDAMDNLQTYESKYAIFKYEKVDENLIKDLSDYIDLNAKKIINFFNIDNISKITIRIYSTKKEYDEKIANKIFNGKPPKWGVGNYGDGIINYVSHNDYINTTHYNEEYEMYLKTILHEYIHFVVDVYSSKNNYKSLYHPLNEGIACYLSGQYDGKEYHDIVPISQINSNYKYQYMIVKYILEEKGKDYFLSLFKNREETINNMNFIINEMNDFNQKSKGNIIQ